MDTSTSRAPVAVARVTDVGRLDSGAPDSIDTGPGDDVVQSRDGRRDRVRCGDGRDTIDADPLDLLSGCEIAATQRRQHIG